jgi:hypothetical protein
MALVRREASLVAVDKPSPLIKEMGTPSAVSPIRADSQGCSITRGSIRGRISASIVVIPQEVGKLALSRHVLSERVAERICERKEEVENLTSRLRLLRQVMPSGNIGLLFRLRSTRVLLEIWGLILVSHFYTPHVWHDG